MRRFGMRLGRWDDNGRALLGDFRRNALHPGWTKEEVGALVVEAAMAGDYHGVVRAPEPYVSGGGREGRDAKRKDE